MVTPSLPIFPPSHMCCQQYCAVPSRGVPSMSSIDSSCVHSYRRSASISHPSSKSSPSSSSLVGLGVMRPSPWPWRWNESGDCFTYRTGRQFFYITGNPVKGVEHRPLDLLLHKGEVMNYEYPRGRRLRWGSGSTCFNSLAPQRFVRNFR